MPVFPDDNVERDEIAYDLAQTEYDEYNKQELLIFEEDE